MDEAGLSEFGVGEAGISCCVKLRGLPFKALEQDISDFFDGYNVQRALLKRYPDGRPNGEVPAAILSQLLCVPYVITGAHNFFLQTCRPRIRETFQQQLFSYLHARCTGQASAVDK